jgi:hypothetical protein
MPSSPDRRHEAPPAHKGEYLRIPDFVIKGVYVNSALSRKFANPFYEELFLNRDAIVGLGAFFAPYGAAAREALYIKNTPKSSTRAHCCVIPTEPIVVDGIAYPEITAKGTGMIETDYQLSQDLEGKANGLFGLQSAQKELEISERLSELGIRSARVLGIIELDPEKLKAWINDVIIDDTRKTALLSSLGVVAKNGDIPAILVRFTQPRILDLAYVDNKYRQPSSYGHRDKIILRSIETLRYEILQIGVEKWT